MTEPDQDITFMRIACKQALKSFHEGGIPVGAVMVEDGQVIAFGHNNRIQNGDPTVHGEIDCIRKAGRRSRFNAISGVEQNPGKGLTYYQKIVTINLFQALD